MRREYLSDEAVDSIARKGLIEYDDAKEVQITITENVEWLRKRLEIYKEEAIKFKLTTRDDVEDWFRVSDKKLHDFTQYQLLSHFTYGNRLRFFSFLISELRTLELYDRILYNAISYRLIALGVSQSHDLFCKWPEVIENLMFEYLEWSPYA